MVEKHCAQFAAVVPRMGYWTMEAKVDDMRNKIVVEAEDFILKDADGKISARLANEPGEGPFLVLFDAGQPRLVLAIDRGGPTIMVASPQGKPVAVLDCPGAGVSFRFRAEQGDSLFEIKVMEPGPELTLSDADMKYMVVVRAATDGLQVSTLSTPEPKAGFTMPSLSKFIH